MIKGLLWKEWRENQWKLFFCGSVSLALTALLFRIRLFPDAVNCTVISVVQMFAIPVVYALDIFSGEMSNRTIHLLFKFPVPRWKMFFAKYLVCILSVSLIFLATGILMESLTQGREIEMGYLILISLLFGIPSLLLFTWFCAFAAQSRSEAGSLSVIIGLLIGWGIVIFWAIICQVQWAICFVPYSFCANFFGYGANNWHLSTLSTNSQFNQWILSQIIIAPLVLTIACYRFVKIRRVL